MQNRYGKQTEFSGATIGNRRGTPKKLRRATLPESIRTCRNPGETLEIMSKTYRNTDEIQWGSYREPLGDPVGKSGGRRSPRQPRETLEIVQKQHGDADEIQ
jgi:hypothetical protein